MPVILEILSTGKPKLWLLASTLAPNHSRDYDGKSWDFSKLTVNPSFSRCSLRQRRSF